MSNVSPIGPNGPTEAQKAAAKANVLKSNNLRNKPGGISKPFVPRPGNGGINPGRRTLPFPSKGPALPGNVVRQAAQNRMSKNIRNAKLVGGQPGGKFAKDPKTGTTHYLRPGINFAALKQMSGKK